MLYVTYRIDPQLALVTQHDRADISNFVRGARSPRVADIDVLGRIADGLAMPDEARVLLGLAPVDVQMSAIQGGRPRQDGKHRNRHHRRQLRASNPSVLLGGSRKDASPLRDAPCC